MVHIAFASFFGDKIPEVADFDLADAVDASEALFESVGIPREVIIDHKVGGLEVDAFSSGIGGKEDKDIGVIAKAALDEEAFIAMCGTVDGHDGFAVSEEAGDLSLEVREGIAMFGKEDEFSSSSVVGLHSGFVLEEV